MATFYYVTGGSGAWNNSNNWSSTSGGSSGAGIPGSADTAILDGNSGSTNITTDVAINVTAVTLNTGFTGTLTLGSSYGSTVSGTFTVTQGNLNTNGQTCSWGSFSSSGSITRSITLGASNITLSSSGYGPWNVGTNTGLTLSAASSTLTFTTSGLFEMQTANGQTYGTVIFSGISNGQIGGGSFTNLSVTGNASKGANFSLDNSITVTGTLTLTGNSTTNRLLVQGSGQTISNPSTTMVWSNVDFYSVKLSVAYNASSTTGGCGDAGGNTNITFSSSVTQTWSGTSGGNWSANAWTTRVPLPQDDVIISSAFIASQTITADMPRLGRSINWTGSTGSPTWAFSSTSNIIYGSITLISGMTLSGTQALTLAPQASSYTLTPAGLTFPMAVTIGGASNGTLTLAGNFVTSSTLTQSNNTFVDAGYSVTCTTCTIGSASTLTKTGSWSLTSTSAGSIWTCTGSISDTSTITIANASTNSRTFAGGGKTYATLTYTVAGSTGALVVTGSNTFNTINFSDASNARTLTFTSSTTTTVATFNVNGTSGKLMTINASTAGTAASLTTANGFQSCVYLTIQDSTPVQTITWFCGHNSTLVSNTGNWVLGTPSMTALTAGLGFVGADPKKTSIPLSAGMTFAGTFNKICEHLLAAALGSTGALAKSPRKTLGATLGLSGVFSRTGSYFRTLTATVGLQGVLTDVIAGFAVTFNAAVTFGGAAAKVTVKTLPTAALAFAGSITNPAVVILTAALAFVGGIGRAAGKALLATLPFNATPDETQGGVGIEDYGDAAFGQGTPSQTGGVGNLIVTYIKSKGLYFTGAIGFQLQKSLTSILNLTGSQSKSTSRSLPTAALAFAGSLFSPLVVALTAALAFVGGIGRQAEKALPATASFLTGQSKVISRQQSASLGLAGTMLDAIPKAFAAALAFVGNLLTKWLPPPAPLIVPITLQPSVFPVVLAGAGGSS
jgi:hypothetical protein